MRLLSYILFFSLVRAYPPDWMDTPGVYEFTASMTATVLVEGDVMVMSDDGDILAAFDDSDNIRGISTMLDGLGSYEGIALHSITIRSNQAGDEISFKYYDASADIIHDLEESYTFVINELVGNLMFPHTLPPPFEFNMSSQSAYYFFHSVTINDVSIEANDWVGAFRGDVCVGARKWDTSECNSGVCDLPVMGFDGLFPDATEGYMESGDIPTFKIYDVSENAYYVSTPSDNISWNNLSFNNIYWLSAFASISGCLASDACNYNAYAIEDDGSCIYGVCDDMAISQIGSNIPEEYSISQNYPNPFNPVTHIEYNIAQYSRVMIRIFDMGGRLITELYNGNQVPGRYEITWNARQYTSGMYLLEIMSLSNQNNLNFRDVKKLLYLK